MGTKILESAVISRLPAVKAPPSKLKAISRERNQRNYFQQKNKKMKQEAAAKISTTKDDGVSVLLLDDDTESRHTIRHIGKRLGFNIYGAGSFTQALRTFDVRQDIGIAILNFDGHSGINEKTLKALKERYPSVSVIGIASLSNTGWVIDLVSKGYIFRYLPDTFAESDFEAIVLSANKRHQMLTKMEELRDQVKSDHSVVNTINKIKLLFG